MSEIFRNFTSITEYCQLKKSVVNDWAGSRVRNPAECQNWYGCVSYEEAVRTCKAGTWVEGRERMERELVGFTAQVATSLRRRSVWSDQGDSLDVHRVYAGQLDIAWRRTQKIAYRASRNIVISFPLMISVHDHAEKMFWCGAAALKLTEVLTVANYTVTLIGTHGTSYGGYTGHDSLVVKEATAPLDIEALIVAVAFPGFARTAGLTAIESNEFEISYGHGYAIYDDPAPLATLNLPKVNILRGLYDQVRDRESARRWIAEQLTKLEGELT